MFDVHSRISYRARTTNFAAHRSATWTVCDLAFRSELVELGLPAGRKSARVAPPSVPYSAPDYLRGVVDGDGSVGFTGADLPFVSLTTASPAFAEHFCSTVFALTGARRTVAPNRRDGVYNPMVANDPAATVARWLYPPGCLALERKRLPAQRVAAWTRPTGMRARPVDRRPWTAEEDARVVQGTLAEAAAVLNRTVGSVGARRWRLRGATRAVRVTGTATVNGACGAS